MATNVADEVNDNETSDVSETNLSSNLQWSGEPGWGGVDDGISGKGG